MLDVKCIMVIGPGGARIDFIAGWLGTLPNFVNSNWHITPITGQSKINNDFSKMMDWHRDPKLRELLHQYRFNLTENAITTLALPNHGLNWEHQIDQVDLQSSAVKIINILIDQEDFDTVSWEFVCKTFLTDKKDQTDKNITDADHINLAIEKFNNYYISHSQIPDATILRYKKLFVPGGSYYLAESLGLTNISKEFHDYYDTMLTLAKTPDEIFRYGKLWRKQDYLYSRKRLPLSTSI